MDRLQAARKGRGLWMARVKSRDCEEAYRTPPKGSRRLVRLRRVDAAIAETGHFWMELS